MHTFTGAVFALIFAAAIFVPHAHAQTNISSLTSTLESLMKQVADLQKQLVDVRGEINETIEEGLREGMTHEDIRKIQEVLATDANIYPERLTTGYFGPLTQNALRKFQEKFDLEVTGEIDDETREAFEELFKERTNGRLPEGLLRAPGIQQKIEARLARFCKDGTKVAGGALCVRIKDIFFEKIDKDKKDADEDEEHDRDDAVDAIDEAKQAIETLRESIADAKDDDIDTEEAEDALDDARDLRSKAQRALVTKKYADAVAYADDAKKTANDAAEELEDEEAE